MVCVLDPVRAVQAQLLATQTNTWHVVTFGKAAYSHSSVSIKDYDGVPENCCGNLIQCCNAIRYYSRQYVSGWLMGFNYGLDTGQIDLLLGWFCPAGLTIHRKVLALEYFNSRIFVHLWKLATLLVEMLTKLVISSLVIIITNEHKWAEMLKLILAICFTGKRAQNLGMSFLTFIILYNNLIPISLTVTLEV